MQHVYDRYPSTRNGIFSSTVRPRVAWAQKAKNSFRRNDLGRCHVTQILFLASLEVWATASAN